MLVIVSNRSINEGATDETLFGEQTNAKGIDELRLAKASYNEPEERWMLELLSESEQGLSEENLPSRRLFNEILEGISNRTHRCNWMFYIHGFNQSFLQGLKDSWAISQRYDLDLIAFSWPSNPGGFVTTEYTKARQAAKASANALDRILEKMGRYLSTRSLEEVSNCQVSLNLLAHSLGNFLMESYIRNPVFSTETRIFDHVIFHQADVDVQSHIEWIDRVIAGQRLYVTINESDNILKASDTINPARLGNTLEGLTARRPIYVDFTNGQNVGRSHNLFLDVENNAKVHNFFQRVFTGKRGEQIEGFEYDHRRNAYRLLE